MNTDPELEKFDALAAQIQHAQHGDAEQPADTTKPMKASNIGFEFLGAVLGGTFLGWIADKTLGTKPWGLLIFMILGFIVGIMGIWRVLGASSNEGNQKSE